VDEEVSGIHDDELFCLAFLLEENGFNFWKYRLDSIRYWSCCTSEAQSIRTSQKWT